MTEISKKFICVSADKVTRMSFDEMMAFKKQYKLRIPTYDEMDLFRKELVKKPILYSKDLTNFVHNIYYICDGDAEKIQLLLLLKDE